MKQQNSSASSTIDYEHFLRAMDIACPIDVMIRVYDFNNIMGYCLYATGHQDLIKFDRRGNVLKSSTQHFIDVLQELDLIREFERRVYYTRIRIPDYYLYLGYENKNTCNIHSLERKFGFIGNEPVLILNEVEKDFAVYKRVLYISNGNEELVRKHLVKRKAKDFVQPEFKHLDY